MLMTMAKPIPVTSTLTGKDAERFLKRMIAVENGQKSENSKETAMEAV